MSELRHDPITREWVVITVERAKHPDQFHRQVDHRDSNAEDKSTCPFCPGNERLTPEEVFALPLSGRKYEVAIQHYDDTGRCLYCDVVAEEKAIAKRVVLETSHLLVFHPFASQVPFETWIAPKRHNPCFAHINPEEKREPATVLRRVLRALYDALGDPDFNLIVHTAPVEDEEKPMVARS